MPKIALKYKNNWADEFNIEGFIIVEQSWWEEHKRNLKQNSEDFPQDVYFGTNEDIEYANIRDYIGCFTKLDLTQDEIRMLETNFGVSFGIVPLIEFD